MKVLLVDSSSVLRRRLYDRLREVPSLDVVGQAACEDQAVLAASLSAPDVVLAGMTLARGDGLNALRRLRSAGYLGIAYLLTGGKHRAHGLKDWEAGIDDVYNEHHDLDRLLQTLKSLSENLVALVPSRASSEPQPAWMFGHGLTSMCSQAVTHVS